jgi:hypothetical protein
MVAISITTRSGGARRMRKNVERAHDGPRPSRTIPGEVRRIDYLRHRHNSRRTFWEILQKDRKVHGIRNF